MCSIEALVAFENQTMLNPKLGYPYYHRMFSLDIAASDYGIDAVLRQESKGKMKVISYASTSVPKY